MILCSPVYHLCFKCRDDSLKPMDVKGRSDDDDDYDSFESDTSIIFEERILCYIKR